MVVHRFLIINVFAFNVYIFINVLICLVGVIKSPVEALGL